LKSVTLAEKIVIQALLHTFGIKPAALRVLPHITNNHDCSIANSGDRRF
jgi:hypothetical protein